MSIGGTRIGNMIKAGFYPTPLEEVGSRLVQLFELDTTQRQKDFAIFDPCAGEGHILKMFQDHFKENPEMKSMKSYAIEFEEERAVVAEKQLDRVLCSDAFDCTVQNNYFGFIYLNPPYMPEVRVEKFTKLIEYRFLDRALSYLREGGYLCLVLPYTRFGLMEFAQKLSVNFYEKESVILRFDDDNGAFDQFKQCIFIGKLRPSKERGLLHKDDRLFESLSKLINLDHVLENIPTVSEYLTLHDRKTFYIPPHPWTAVMNFRKEVIMKHEYNNNDIMDSDGYKALQRFLDNSPSYKRGQVKHPKDMLKFPISRGQLGLFLIAGAADGEVGEGDTLHTIRGTEDVYHQEQKNLNEDGEVTSISVFSKRRARFTYLTPEGKLGTLI